MQCNIDAKGKAVRLISGAVWCVIGLVVVLAGVFFFRSVWVWVGGSVLILAGAFQIFEGRTGWCVVRAMGFKTPV